MSKSNFSVEQKVVVYDDGQEVLNVVFTRHDEHTSDVVVTTDKALDNGQIRKLLFATIDAVGYTFWRGRPPWKENEDDVDFQEDLPF